MAGLSDVVDLEDIVKLWAWQMFDCTKTKDQAKFPREQLMMNVNWKRVKFIHSEPEYTDTHRSPQPKSQVLFKTFFTNNTDLDQEYSFKTERMTRSSCEVFIEKGFTIGYEMNVSLKTPCEVFEANAGFHRELSLTKSTGEVFEEEMSWGVDSQIKVPPKHHTTAELVISEDQYGGNFTVTSTFSGKVLVTITNLKDNNSLLKTVEGDIAEIVKNSQSNGHKGFTINKRTVIFETKGRTSFRFAVEQHVKLNQEQL